MRPVAALEQPVYDRIGARYLGRVRERGAAGGLSLDEALALAQSA